MVESGVGVTGVDDSQSPCRLSSRVAGPEDMERCQSLSCRPGIEAREAAAGAGVAVLAPRPGKKAGCELPEVDVNTQRLKLSHRHPYTFSLGPDGLGKWRPGEHHTCLA